LLAAKLVTEFVAAFNVVPVAELVVSKPPEITPDPPMEPLFDVTVIALLPAVNVLVRLMLPDPAVALLFVMLIVPKVSLMAFTVRALALSVKLMLPLVPLLAAKLVTEFVAAFNVVPVAELVVSKPLVIAPDSLMEPLFAVNVTALVPALSAPVTLILPVILLLVIVTLLVVAALSVIPVRFKLPLMLSNKFTLPLTVFVALKPETTFVAVSSNVPVFDVVVSVPPVMTLVLSVI